MQQVCVRLAAPVVSMLGLATLLGLTSGARAEVTKNQVRGDSASLYYSALSPDECIYTFVSVQAYAAVTSTGQGKPQSGQSNFVSVSILDLCGGANEAEAIILDAGFTQQGTREAVLDAKGTGIFGQSIQVQINWTGFGAKTTSSDHVQMQNGDTMIHANTRSTQREASVIGSISIDGVVVTAFDQGTVDAALHENSQGQLLVVHP